MDENGISVRELLKETAIAFIILSLYFLLTGKYGLFYGFAIGHGMYMAGIYHLAHVTAHVLSLHTIHISMAKSLLFLSFGMRYGVGAIILILLINYDLEMFYGGLIGIVLVILIMVMDSIICYVRNYINAMIQ